MYDPNALLTLSAEGEDYETGGPIEATFPSSTTSNGDSACVDITILDDMAYESDHSFGIILGSATPDAVIIGNQFAFVNILDNDGEWFIRLRFI